MAITRDMSGYRPATAVILGGHRSLSLATSLAFKLRTPSATDLVVRICAAAQG